MKIIVCDDEGFFVEKFSSQLISIAARLGEICEIVKCTNGFEVMDHCEKEVIDAIVLDIAMPGINGFEVAEFLQKRFKKIVLLFISSKEDMMFSSYAYDPFWFVPKSKLKELPQIMEKFVLKVRERGQESDLLHIKMRSCILEIDLSQLFYFESNNHTLTMVTATGKETYREKIGDIEQQLEKHWFIRTHIGYLVNCRKIREISKGCVVLHNGESVPISRGKLPIVKEKYQEYLRSRRW